MCTNALLLSQRGWLSGAALSMAPSTFTDCTSHDSVGHHLQRAQSGLLERVSSVENAVARGMCAVKRALRVCTIGI